MYKIYNLPKMGMRLLSLKVRLTQLL